MWEMESCKVSIVTQTGGKRVRFESDGSAEHSDGLYVRYDAEGDRALLLWNGETLRMERRGELRLDAEFVCGSTTEMTLRLAEGTFRIPLKTSALTVCEEGGDFRFTLTYDLHFGKDLQRFHLEISISSEE